MQTKSNTTKHKNNFETPILFVIFNRPDITQKVFNEIKKIRPKKLFITADGPRNNEEKKLCNKTRKIIEQVDWECEIKKNYSNKNLGCKIGVSSGINWFFKHVEAGIILEDDCLPNQSFFYFCKELLERYKDNKKIMMISGDNFQNKKQHGNGSYYFSKMCHIWGWATWKRAWQHYDVNMKDYPEFKKQNKINTIWGKKYIQKYWIKIFDQIYNKEIDTWDYQWVYSVWKQNGLSIIPNVNLISNIGFRDDATHTKSPNKLANKQLQTLKKIKHPQKIIQSKKADNYFLYNSIKKGTNNYFLYKITHMIKSIFKRFWTASPKSIYNKINKLLNHDQKIKTKKVTIDQGQAKGITITVPEIQKGYYGDMTGGNYEGYILETIQKHDIKNKTIWDVGAHMGYHSLLFAKYIGENGKIIAFEPNPKIRKILQENINDNSELSSKIATRKEALSDKISHSTMSISKHGHQTSSSGGYLNTITPPLEKESYKNFECVGVDTDTVDNLIQNKKVAIPYLMKIDIEGAEFDLLKGAKNTLQTIQPILIIEIHNISMMFHVQKLLTKLGYQLKIINEKAKSPTRNILAYKK